MENIEKRIIGQKLRKQEKGPMDLAIRYYMILSAINDIGLTEREIQLIAFTAIKGNILYPDIKEEFCTLYKSSSPTINNIISKLKKLSILVKDGNKIKVNPKILLNFEDSNIVLQVTLNG